MIIQIDEKTRIEGTERCWELQRRCKRKGKAAWTPYKYFDSFGSALAEAVHRDIRLHPASTLSDAIEAVADVVQRYDQLIPSRYRLTTVQSDTADSVTSANDY